MMGTEVFRELKRTDGIRSFLYPSYPALHTQSKDYIVDETIQYITLHNAAFVEQKSVSLLADRLSISHERSLDLFYNSDTYSFLSRKMYHLHNMSAHRGSDSV